MNFPKPITVKPVAPTIDFGKIVKERADESLKIYEAGHKEGYRLGFSEGLAEAKKIVESSFGQLLEKKT